MKTPSSRKNINGQGMSEYLVIVGLIAVAGIAVMGFAGNTIRGQISSFSQELAGGSGDASNTAAGASALNSESARDATLSTFDENNAQLP